MDLHSALPSNTDTCPPKLREVLERWKRGKASNQELSAMSYEAALDILDAYRSKPLPLVPEAVWKYRNISPDDRELMDFAARTKLCERHKDFFLAEQRIKTVNESNKAWLEAIFAWAKEQQQPRSVLAAIKQAHETHMQPTKQAIDKFSRSTPISHAEALEVALD